MRKTLMIRSRIPKTLTKTSIEQAPLVHAPDSICPAWVLPRARPLGPRNDLLTRI